MTRPDLTVEIGPTVFANPVLCASGTFGYGIEIPDATRALGGVVTKTITRQPRAGNPPTRIWETPSGMLNSIGLQNVGVDRFVAEKLPALRPIAARIVVSVGGRTAEEFEEVVARLDDAPGIDAYEINISCPNVREGGIEFSQSEEAAARVVSRVRRRTRRPLWTKLSPNVTAIGRIARAVEEAGSNAITAINTYVGMVVDPHTRSPRIPSGTGGLSGPAIRPLALAKVHEVVRNVAVPVVAVGGIVSGGDALEFLIVGARAVQVGTAQFIRPDQGSVVIREVEEWLAASGCARIDEVIGSYRGGES